MANTEMQKNTENEKPTVEDREWADGDELLLTTGKEGEWMKLENPEGTSFETGAEAWL